MSEESDTDLIEEEINEELEVNPIDGDLVNPNQMKSIVIKALKIRDKQILATKVFPKKY